MPSRKWDPHRYLQIATRGSLVMTCAGNTKYGNRCRWDIAPVQVGKVCAILDRMEMMSPKDGVRFLGELAQLSLCKDYHRGRASEVIAEWQSAIEDASREHEIGEGLRSRNRVLEIQLREERAGQEARYCQLQNCAAAEEELKRLRSSLANSQAQYANMERYVTEEQSKLSSELAAEQRSSYESKINAVATCHSLSQTIGGLRSKLQAQDKVSNKFEGQLDKSQATNRALHSDAKVLESKIFASRREANDAAAERTRLIEQFENSQAQLSAWQERSDELSINLEQAKASQAATANELEVTKFVLGTERGNVSRLRVELATAEAEVASTQSSVEHAEYAAQEANENLREIEEQNETSKASLSLEIETTNSLLKTERNDMAQMRLYLATVENELASSRKSLDHSQHEVHYLRYSYDNQSSELTTVHESLETVKRELESSHKTNVDLEGELKATQNTHKQTQLALQSSWKTDESLRKEFDVSKKELKKIQIELQSSREANEDRNIELANIQGTLEQTQLELEASLKTNEAQKIAAIFQEAATAAEIDRLLHRISQLETTFLGSLLQGLRMWVRTAWNKIWERVWKTNKLRGDIIQAVDTDSEVD